MASPLQQFVIEPVADLHIAGFDVSFTQSAAFMFLAVAVATALMTLTIDRRALVPGRMQSVAEMLYEFVFGMVRDTMGQKGRAFFPFVFSIFIFVLLGNLLGLFPYAFTFTSHIIVTFALAMTVFLLATLVGFVIHGAHFLSFFVPAGIPLYMVPIILPIEIISYLSRPISLSVRLFANMVAGHTMLKVFAGFSVMMAAAGFGGLLGSIIPLVANIALLGLELLVAAIQAYVFAILTCIYLKDAIELH